MTHDIYDLLDQVAAVREDLKATPDRALVEQLADAAIELLADLEELGLIVIKTGSNVTAPIVDMTVERGPKPAVLLTVMPAF